MADWANAWLGMQCNMISGVSRGVIALGAPDRGPYRPVSYWPASSASDDNKDLLAILEAATSKQELTVQQEPTGQKRASSPLYIANPIMLKGELVGAVAIVIDKPSPEQQEAVIQLLKWGAAWLKLLLEREQKKPTQSDNSQLAMVLSLIVIALEHVRFRAAATALATELATRFQCERVSFGFRVGKHIQVDALSHSAVFDKRSNLIQCLSSVMDEALVQGNTILFERNSQNNQLSSAHAYLSENFDSTNICTLPLSIRGDVFGVLVLERVNNQGFDPETVKLVKEAGALLGPILYIKRQHDLGLGVKLRDWFDSQAERLFGEGHAVFKAVTAGSLVILLLLTFIKGDYRIVANAMLEGSVQRAVVSPMEGYIATAKARAGDVIKVGDVLGTLEDKDLKLEQVRLSNQGEQLQKEYRNALATRDRSQTRVLNARIAQNDAQLELIQEQLSRTQLKAPIDGMVVKGDLSQSLGSPVERGLVLFEVAPLDEYRIILHVDERDITKIEEGKQGQLTLTALPGETLLFSITRITPVSSQENGSNTFRVEAKLHEPSQQLRPGMEGAGKITVGRHRLIWIWTHTLVDWLRLTIWAW